MRVFVDIETYSSVDLKKYGAYRYAASSDFLILMAAWSVDGGPIEVDETHSETVARFLDLRAAGATFVAHNAPFERICFTHALRNCLELEPDEWLPPESFEDTMALAAEQGWPKGLGKLAKALGAEEKDEAGTLLINWFCKPISSGKAKGQRRLPQDHPEKWGSFLRYCSQDVATLVDVDDRLHNRYGGWPTDMERRVFLADQRINDRGIAIDVEMARRAWRVGQLNTRDQQAEFTALTGVENPGSTVQLGAWAERTGLRSLLPNFQAETIERALRGNLAPDVRAALELRQELALAAPAKFEAAINGQVGGRLRGTLAFFGAHTGRWAGRGTQVQNLPRAGFTHDVDMELALHDLMVDGEQISSEELKMLVRPMFIGPFTVVDYAAIEARVIAWLAGEQWALDAFWEGRDIYVETAERMGGLTRAQGKIAVLALGYNGGANSLRAMAGDRDYIAVDGKQVLLRHLPDQVLFDELVYPWRAANPAIVKLWKVLDNRFRTGGSVGEHLAFEKHGKDRLLRLPSGRYIAYRNCSIRRDAEGRERLTFMSPKGFRQDTYGGRLAENATQAVARDILAEALVRLDDAGYAVPAHVHDEILVEGTHSVEDISAVMCQPPTWATGLPIGGSGFTTYRYRKD